MANAKNIGLFAAAAVLAVVGGVSVAEWQTQRSRSDAKAEAAPEAPAEEKPAKKDKKKAK